MAESLDEIVVTIRAETEKFEKGMGKASGSLDAFQEDSKKTASKSDNLKKSFDKTGNSAKDMGKSMDESADSIEGVSDANDKLSDTTDTAADKTDKLADAERNEASESDKAAESHKKNAKHVETMGEKFDTAINKAFSLKDAFKALAGGFTAVALINAIKQVIDKLIEADKQVINLRNDLKTLTTSQIDADRYENIILKEKNKLEGDYTEEQRVNVIVEVERNFGELDESYKFELKQAILAATSAYGVNEIQLADDLREIMSKWNLPLDEAVAYLRQIEEISNLQAGNVSDNLQANLDALSRFDDMAQQMGWSYDELLKYMQALDTWDNNNNKDVNETLELWYRQWTSWQSEQKAASESVPEINKEIQAVQEEIRAAMESGDDTAALYTQLTELRQQLADAETTVAMTFQDFVSELMKGTDYAGLEGKELEEMKQAREIKIESQNVVLPELDTSYIAEITDSIGTDISKKIGTAIEGLVTTFDPNESFAQYKDETNQLFKDYYKYLDDSNSGLTKTFLDGYNNIDKKIDELYGGVIAPQERYELIREYIIEFDKENLEGKFTQQITDADTLKNKVDKTVESTKNLNTELETTANIDLSKASDSMEYVAESSEKASDKLTDANEQISGLQTTIGKIDTTDAVKQVENLTESISGDEGVTESTVNLTDAQALNATAVYNVLIPSDDDLIVSIGDVKINVDKLVDSWIESVDTIKKSVIPANSSLISSLKDVASAYRDVAAAKSAAGM